MATSVRSSRRSRRNWSIRRNSRQRNKRATVNPSPTARPGVQIEATEGILGYQDYGRPAFALPKLRSSPADHSPAQRANMRIPVRIWCTPLLDAPLGPISASRTAMTWTFFGVQTSVSGRRDSNPRPSPWRGAGIRPRSVAPSVNVDSVGFFVREVLPNPPRSNTRYYG